MIIPGIVPHSGKPSPARRVGECRWHTALAIEALAKAKAGAGGKPKI